MTMEDSSVPFLSNAEAAVQSAVRKHKVKPLSLLPLVALIFYDVSGGPFGIEVCYSACSTSHSASVQRFKCYHTSHCTRCTSWNWGEWCSLRCSIYSDYAHKLTSLCTSCCTVLQDAVSAGGPLLAILGFMILPLVWSVPEALITAELATTFPENSGYVAWVTAAFGPFWGFQVPFGFCALVSCLTDMPIQVHACQVWHTASIHLCSSYALHNLFRHSYLS